MKIWIPIIVLLFAVTGLCIWDTIHTERVFDYMERESNNIYISLQSSDITNENIVNKIKSLNEYWTKEMDTLCISISRKDLQPISDYLQYLYASTINESQDDAVTYSRLLSYNIEGLSESLGVNVINLL
ncbi:MAG: DUF4363 family protein [Clostridiales bacterium]|nr:DUF4363 family protein [Clostridiales bacterium]